MQTINPALTAALVAMLGRTVLGTPERVGPVCVLEGRSKHERRRGGDALGARRAGFDAEARATIAPTTWQGIVDVADELDAAVIVVGSCGLGGLREFTRGSVSHDVATHARRPVLIVPPPHAKGTV